MAGASLEGLQRRRLLALQLGLPQPPRASEASRLVAWLGVQPALFGTPRHLQPPTETLEQLHSPGQEGQEQQKLAGGSLEASGLDDLAATRRRMVTGRQALRNRRGARTRGRVPQASQPPQPVAVLYPPTVALVDAGCSSGGASGSSSGSSSSSSSSTCSASGNDNSRDSGSSSTTSSSSSRGKKSTGGSSARTAADKPTSLTAAAAAPVFLSRPNGPPAPELWFLSDSGSDTDSDSGPQPSRMRFRSCRFVADLCRPWRPASRGPAAARAASGGGGGGGGDSRGSSSGCGGGGGGMPPLERLRADLVKMQDQRREWRRIARREDWVAEEAPSAQLRAPGVQAAEGASDTAGTGAAAAAGAPGLSAAGVVYGYCRPLDARERLARAAWRAARSDAVAAALPALESRACAERIRENKEMVSIMQIMQMTPQARNSAEALMRAFQQKMLQSQARMQAARPFCQEVGRAALEFVHDLDTDAGRCRAAAAAARATQAAAHVRVLGFPEEEEEEEEEEGFGAAPAPPGAANVVAGTAGYCPSPQLEAETGMVLLWALAGMRAARLLGRRRECGVAALCRGLWQRLQRRGGGAGLLVHGSGGPGGGPGGGHLLTSIPPLVSEVHRELAVTELAARLRRLQHRALAASLTAGPAATAASAAAAAAATSPSSSAAPPASTAAAAAADQPSGQPEAWLRLARMSLGAAYATAAAAASSPAPHPSSSASSSNSTTTTTTTSSAAAASAAAGVAQPALFSPAGAAAAAAWTQLMARAGGAAAALWGPLLRALVEEEGLRRSVVAPMPPSGTQSSHTPPDQLLRSAYRSRGVAGVAAVLARADPGALAAVAGLLPPATAVASGVSAAAGVTGGGGGGGGGGAGVAAFGDLYWRLDWLGFFPVVTLGEGKPGARREPAQPTACAAAAAPPYAAAPAAAATSGNAVRRQEAVLVGRAGCDDGRSGLQRLGELCAWLQAGRPVACAGGAAVWLVLTQLQQLERQRAAAGVATPAAVPAGGTIAGRGAGGLGVAWLPHRLVPPEEARTRGGLWSARDCAAQHAAPARWLQPDGEMGGCCVVLQPLGPLLPPSKDSSRTPAADQCATAAWLSGAEALRMKNNPSSDSLSLVHPYLTAAVAQTGRAALVCEGAEALEHAVAAMCQARAELLLERPSRQLVCVAQPVPLALTTATGANNDPAGEGGKTGTACCRSKSRSRSRGGSGTARGHSAGVHREQREAGAAPAGGGGAGGMAEVEVEVEVEGAARMVVALVEVSHGAGVEAALRLQHPLAATGSS